MKAFRLFLLASVFLPGPLCAVLAVPAAAAQAPLDLAGAVNYPVGRSGNNTRNVAVGDFDGDGNFDMAVPNSTDRTVSIQMGKRDGTFSSAGAYTTDDGSRSADPRWVVAADFNEDGLADLAVADSGLNAAVVLLGNGNGTFAGRAQYGAGTQPNGLTVGDFNRDGHLDLAVANAGGTNVSILRGQGNGTFLAALNYGAGTSPYAVAAGDLDRDGDLDLAVANRVTPGGTVSVLLNDGAGAFPSAATYAAGDRSRAVEIGDFDRDGKLDLAVANENSWDVATLLGNGNGTFRTAVSHPAGSNPRGVAAADLNGDGALDLAVTDGNDNFVYLLQGNGDGTFEATIPFMVGRRPDGVSLADFDRDGRPDVVTANTNSDSEQFGIWNVSVLLNATLFDPTGLLAAKVDYPVEINPNAVLSADFNRDGIPDLVTANVTSRTVSYLRGVGDGMFEPRTDFVLGVNFPYWLTSLDFNRDGKLDLAVAALDGSVTIMWGDGAGGFPSGFGTATAGIYPVFVAAGDFNGDGRPDVATANAGSDDITVLLGNGLDGYLSPPAHYAVGATPYAIAVADLNLDGHQDLAVANFYSSSVSVLLGRGDGTFAPPSDFDTGYDPVAVAAADLDADGIPDLATANYWSGDVSVLRGAGDGTFLAPVNYAVGANPSGIVVGDFFRDGVPDLAVTCEAAAKIAILPGKGDGTFAAPGSFVTAAGPASLAGGDFDRDGKMDLATANWEGGNLSVLLNWKDAVNAPATPAGISLVGAAHDKGVPGSSYGFSTGGSVSTMGHPVEYQFDWNGDGTSLSGWGPAIKSNGWDLKGTYHVRARSRCAAHPDVVSDWSGVLTIDIGGPTITNLQIEGGAADTGKTTAAITYAASASATQIRTSIGGAWSAWLPLPVSPHNVSLGTLNGLVHVYAQVQDADGRVSAIAWDTINLDTKPPVGVVKINGGNTTVRSGGPTTTVRVHMAMFDASLGGAQVRVKPDVTFAGDVDPAAPWGAFSGSATGTDVLLRGAGVQKVYVQFMDGVGLKSAVYPASITISATGLPWPAASAVSVTNVALNDGQVAAASTAVRLTYDVSQGTNIMARYLYGTAWTPWETPAVVAGKVTKSLVLTTVNGPRQVYVQLLETAGSASPGAMTDPAFDSILLDTLAPSALVQVNNGATSIRRFNTNLNYVIVNVLGVDSGSGIDKIALSQTGSLASATVPPPASSPDWVDFNPTVDSFGLKTYTTGSKAVYVWLKDKAGKISLRKSAAVSVLP